MQKSHLFHGEDRVIVFAAHPDDEVLGCGATVAKHVAAGDSVDVVILAEGLTSRDLERNQMVRAKELDVLQKTALMANAELGVKNVEFLGFPDNRMDEIPLISVIKQIERIKERVQPTVVYTHFPADLNIDHRITAEAVMTAFRPQPSEPLKVMAFFEVLSSTNWFWKNPSLSFSPTFFVDVDSYIEKKIDALKVYASEMREWPHSRSIEAVRHLAGLRGSDIGVPNAEAYALARWVQ